MCSSCKLITWYPSVAVRGSFIFGLALTELFWQSSYGTMKTAPALWRSNVFYIILLHPGTCIKSYPRSTSKATTKRFNLFLSFKNILSICRFVVVEGYTYWKLTSISPSHNSFAFQFHSLFSLKHAELFILELCFYLSNMCFIIESRVLRKFICLFVFSNKRWIKQVL